MKKGREIIKNNLDKFEGKIIKDMRIKGIKIRYAIT